MGSGAQVFCDVLQAQVFCDVLQAQVVRLAIQLSVWEAMVLLKGYMLLL